ncbi:MAG: hypothetical protein QE278_00425 [Limnobacter sp.]|nr:hypothetical protein [Limnobacter sp.]
MSQAPISIQRSCRIPVRLETCFKTFVNLDPKDFLHHDKVIAPIRHIDMVRGEKFDHVGAVQAITFKDGVEITEELMAFVENRQIVYKGTGFTQPLVNWVEYVNGAFEFERLGEQTVFTWKYNFYLKPSPLNVIRKPIFQAIVVNVLWNRLMTKTLKNLVKVITLRAK